MNKDLKNVLITFGLIGIIFAMGSFMYKKSSQNIQSLSEYQAVLSEIKKAEQINTDQSILIAQLKSEQSLLIANLSQNKVATGNIKTGTSSIKNTASNSASQAALLAEQQAAIQAQKQAAALLAQQEAARQAQILANQQAQVQAAAQSSISSSPSRQSSAS